MLMPVGEAWRGAWRQNPDAPLYGPDGFHPTPTGTYLAALVIYLFTDHPPIAGEPPRIDGDVGNPRAPAAGSRTGSERATRSPLITSILSLLAVHVCRPCAPNTSDTGRAVACATPPAVADSAPIRSCSVLADRFRVSVLRERRSACDSGSGAPHSAGAAPPDLLRASGLVIRGPPGSSCGR